MLNQTQIEETLRLIRCEVADELYGLDMEWVRSIQRTDRLHWDQDNKHDLIERNDPEAVYRHLVGWLPSNKGDIPVYHLGSRLGCSTMDTRSPFKEGQGGGLQRIIVLNPPFFSQQKINNGEEGLWGLVVDRVMQTIQIPRDLIMPLPPIIVNPTADYFNGVIRLEEQSFLLLAPERIHPDAQISSRREPSRTNEYGSEIEEAMLEEVDRVPKSGHLDSSPGNNAQRPGQIVMFTLQDHHSHEKGLSFGLSISQIPEILDDLPLIPVPSAPDFVLGLLNWRDRPVPLIDLPARFNLSSRYNPTSNGRSRLLIVRDKYQNGSVSCPNDGRIYKKGFTKGVLGAFLIQPSIRILRLPIEHQPSNRTLPIHQDFIRGVVELEGETLLVPNIQTILRGEK